MSKTDKADKIYKEVFNEIAKYSSDTYAEGKKGSVVINGDSITVLNSNDNYIIRDVSLETLTIIVKILNQ